MGTVSLEGSSQERGAEQAVAWLHMAACGTPCPGLDAAVCQADLHLLTASQQGSGISTGASAQVVGRQELGGALCDRRTFSEAGLHLASGGGTGYSLIHGLLTRDAFTRWI